VHQKIISRIDALRTDGPTKTYAAKISKMALLAPDIVTAIEGRADHRMMLKVLDGALPVDREEQRGPLGI
jgi:hypothetical protein